ncbi:hypothetical protein DPMN_148589 [Dreissena polymorpha]|uniref:Uncharacterized protein n=1 Tax=Dreissena polymorpha TaxID=45954 RepID=A0A9D4FC63_DREPO|nr:hypothetical protein DPMN_148589 [Dreissena polymorpha]
MQSKTYATQLLRKSHSPKYKRTRRFGSEISTCTKMHHKLSSVNVAANEIHVADTLRKQLITTKGMGAIAKWLFIQKRKRTRYK